VPSPLAMTDAVNYEMRRAVCQEEPGDLAEIACILSRNGSARLLSSTRMLNVDFTVRVTTEEIVLKSAWL
jgi:hypothetical protein